MKIDNDLKAEDLRPFTEQVFEVAGAAIDRLSSRWSSADGAPVFTIDGRYTNRGWTDWTQGFQFGLPLLVFDASGDERLLRTAREQIRDFMAPHLTHTGVHDHGFNNVSTYGNMIRLISAGRADGADRSWCELALKVSGAVQAARWTPLPDGLGFVHSFNGPHSLFADTIRSMRSLAVAHRLRHVLLAEQDVRVSLLDRLLTHAETTARFNVYFGEGRDLYDEPGRVAHESIFNTKSGTYRNPSSQQGYSPFSTWTRGQAWVILGFAEQLRFVAGLPEDEFVGGRSPYADRAAVLDRFKNVARLVSDHYLSNCAEDGIPYWDTGAPGLVQMGDFRNLPSDPYNRFEPVDSSAAAIAAQGFLRLGLYLGSGEGKRYLQAGLTIARRLFAEPYLATQEGHEGVLLHSVYHRPGGWDHIPSGQSVPNGEATMWGDYHGVELALCIHRMAGGEPVPQFFDGVAGGEI